MPNFYRIQIPVGKPCGYVERNPVTLSICRRDSSKAFDSSLIHFLRSVALQSKQIQGDRWSSRIVIRMPTS